MSFLSATNYKVIEKMYVDHIINRCLLVDKFNRQPRYSWFEKLFCKNIIKEQKSLRQEIQKLTSKPVKWNRYTDVGIKRRKRRETNANKS